MLTVEDIFQKFVTAASLGRAIGRNGIRAAEMRKRGSIPPRYWLPLVKAAKDRGFTEITLEALAKAHEGSQTSASTADKTPEVVGVQQ